jgi:hypothetical protein
LFVVKATTFILTFSITFCVLILFLVYFFSNFSHLHNLLFPARMNNLFMIITVFSLNILYFFHFFKLCNRFFHVFFYINSRRLVFLGDDTWDSLFPTQFDVRLPFDSFNTKVCKCFILCSVEYTVFSSGFLFFILFFVLLCFVSFIFPVFNTFFRLHSFVIF